MKEAASRRAGSEDAATYLVVERDQMPDSELQGYLFGGANVCLIFVDMGPGDGPRLHRHAYDELFVILEGQAKFTVGSDPLMRALDRC